MANDKQVKPTEEFLQLYSELVVVQDEERVSKRFLASHGLSMKLNADLVEQFLDVLFKTKRYETSYSEIVKLFLAQDPLFALNSSNAREVEILSAAVLCLAMKSNSNIALGVALSLVTASNSKGRNLPDFSIDILDTAESALARISRQDRSKPITKNPVSVEPKGYLAVKAKIDAEGVKEEDLPQLQSDLSDELVKFISESKKAIDESYRRAMEHIESQDEELEILWWLFGGRSIHEDKKFESFGEEEKCIVFAKELSDRTKLLPGPTSIMAILQKAGVGEKKVSVVKTVSKLAQKTVADFCVISLSPLTFPLHCALACRNDNDEVEVWSKVWASKAGIGEAHELTSLSLARLFYFERLLLRLKY